MSSEEDQLFQRLRLARIQAKLAMAESIARLARQGSAAGYI